MAYEWSETRPGGDTNIDWDSVAISPDGTKLAAIGTVVLSTSPHYVEAPKLYLSVDGGETWAANDLSLEGTPKVKISDDGQIIVVLNGDDFATLVYSSDGGVTFQNVDFETFAPFSTIDFDLYCYDIFKTLVVCGTKGLTNYCFYIDCFTDGQIISEITLPIGIAAVNKIAYSLTAEYDEALYLVCRVGSYYEIYKTINYGVSWDTLSLGVENVYSVNSLVASLTDGVVGLYGFYSPDVAFSSLSLDGGATFAAKEIYDEGFFSVIAASTDASKVAIATYINTGEGWDVAIAASSDGGATFTNEADFRTVLVPYNCIGISDTSKILVGTHYPLSGS